MKFSFSEQVPIDWDRPGLVMRMGTAFLAPLEGRVTEGLTDRAAFEDLDTVVHVLAGAGEGHRLEIVVVVGVGHGVEAEVCERFVAWKAEDCVVKLDAVIAGVVMHV